MMMVAIADERAAPAFKQASFSHPAIADGSLTTINELKNAKSGLSVH
jgi:hypothetical protein